MYPEQIREGMKISFFCIPYNSVMEGIVKYVCRIYIDVDGITYRPEDMQDIKEIE